MHRRIEYSGGAVEGQSRKTAQQLRFDHKSGGMAGYVREGPQTRRRDWSAMSVQFHPPLFHNPVYHHHCSYTLFVMFQSVY